MLELPIKPQHIHSQPIQIIRKIEQRGLFATRFDPPQNSPPSVWKMRLNKRVGQETKK